MILITGGSKCGRSQLAEKFFDGFDGKKYYIATMQPFGSEALAAIERHRAMRDGKGFETIERYTDISGVEIQNGSGVLLECAANLCANEMFLPDGSISDPTQKIFDGIKILAEKTALLVVVTSDVSRDGESYEPSTRGYIGAMGRLNALLARLADSVFECVYGIPVCLKGEAL